MYLVYIDVGYFFCWYLRFSFYKYCFFSIGIMKRKNAFPVDLMTPPPPKERKKSDFSPTFDVSWWVSALLNEESIKLPGCEDPLGCPWDKFKEQFAYLEKCNFTRLCGEITSTCFFIPSDEHKPFVIIPIFIENRSLYLRLGIRIIALYFSLGRLWHTQYWRTHYVINNWM